MKVLKIIFAFLFTLLCLAVVPILMGLFNGIFKIVLEYLKLDALTAVSTLFGLYVALNIVKGFFKYTRGVINEKK